MAFVNAGFSTFVYSREDEASDKAELVRSFGATYVSSAVTPVEKLPLQYRERREYASSDEDSRYAIVYRFNRTA